MQIQSTTVTPSKVNDNSSVKMSSYELAKKAKDVGILQAHLNQNSAAKDNPQKLLFKAAITEINELLEPYLGENAAQKAYESDIDFSPEATAERIISGSTAFYTSFKENNTDLSEEEAINRFSDIISEGIEKGFADARGVLDSLKVLEGKVGDDIDNTYNIVQKGLLNFKETLLTELAPKENPEQTA